MSEDIKELRKQIQALQQEYDELDTGHSKLFKAYCEMKQENEQLQAQVARMREALETISQFTDELCVHEAIAAIDKIGGRE